jgi:hypothetical protein
MVVINDIIPALWTKDHGDHMFAEKLFNFLPAFITLYAFITPMLAFGFDLTHPNGELRWT